MRLSRHRRLLLGSEGKKGHALPSPRLWDIRVHTRAAAAGLTVLGGGTATFYCKSALLETSKRRFARRTLQRNNDAIDLDLVNREWGSGRERRLLAGALLNLFPPWRQDKELLVPLQRRKKGDRGTYWPNIPSVSGSQNQNLMSSVPVCRWGLGTPALLMPTECQLWTRHCQRATVAQGGPWES